METLSLPTPISRYLELGNRGDYDAIASCFTSDATVVDEDRTYRGHEQIRAWAQSTREQYQFRATPTGLEDQDGATVVTCHVTGNFPGNPVDLRYNFQLEGDKIASLEIVG